MIGTISRNMVHFLSAILSNHEITMKPPFPVTGGFTTP